MTYLPDPRAPKRKRALEAKARALGVPIPGGFHASVPFVGPGARLLLGEVEIKARLPLTHEFDTPMLRYLFPPPAVPVLRRNVVGVAGWMIRHNAEIGYTQDEPRAYPLERKPLTLLGGGADEWDCSMAVDICYFWAGVPASHCPMGNAYALSGNTQTLFDHGRGIAISNAQLADVVIWGHDGATHHAALVIADAGTADPLLMSHGREACPCAVRFSAENAAQAGRPASWRTYLGG